jgi:hypothetical protein
MAASLPRQPLYNTFDQSIIPSLAQCTNPAVASLNAFLPENRSLRITHLWTSQQSTMPMMIPSKRLRSIDSDEEEEISRGPVGKVSQTLRYRS